jgi:hypothetical protein
MNRGAPAIAQTHAALRLGPLFAAGAESGRLARTLGLPDGIARRLAGTGRIGRRLSDLVADSLDLPPLPAAAILSGEMDERDRGLLLATADDLDRVVRWVGLGWQAPALNRIILATELRAIVEACGRPALDFALRHGRVLEGRAAPAAAQSPASSCVIGQVEALGRACLEAWANGLAPAIGHRVRFRWPLPESEPTVDGEPAAGLVRRVARHLLLGEAAG